MRRFILGVVVVLLAGQAGAVELQEGDVIFIGRFEGQEIGYTDPSLIMRISVETGEREILSGCLDADCVEFLDGW